MYLPIVKTQEIPLMPNAADQVDDHMLVASFRDEKLKEAAFTQLVRKYQERFPAQWDPKLGIHVT